MGFIQNLECFFLLILIIFISACNGQHQTKANLKKKDIHSINKQRSEASNYVNFDHGVICAYLDSESVLWFGSYGGGLYRYKQGSFSHFTEKDGLCDNQVCSIMEDKNGILWFGTAKGLCRYDRKQFTTIAIPQRDTSSVWLDKVYPVVNPNQVMSIVEDDEGIFWIATNGGGAYRYDGQSFTHHLMNEGRKQEDGLFHSIIQDLLKDTDGNIWFPSMIHGGVSRYNGKNFKRYMPEDGLVYDMVRTVMQDRAGLLYFGTLHHGFSRYDGKTFTNFNESDGLCNNNIRCMYEDIHGNIWFGSGIGKTCIYDGEFFTSFKTKEGREIEEILCIIEDSENNIWLGGRLGLWKFNGIEVTDMTQNEKR